jgi:hypothetical protein
VVEHLLHHRQLRQEGKALKDPLNLLENQGQVEEFDAIRIGPAHDPFVVVRSLKKLETTTIVRSSLSVTACSAPRSLAQ